MVATTSTANPKKADPAVSEVEKEFISYVYRCQQLLPDSAEEEIAGLPKLVKGNFDMLVVLAFISSHHYVMKKLVATGEEAVLININDDMGALSSHFTDLDMEVLKKEMLPWLVSDDEHRERIFTWIESFGAMVGAKKLQIKTEVLTDVEDLATSLERSLADVSLDADSEAIKALKTKMLDLKKKVGLGQARLRCAGFKLPDETEEIADALNTISKSHWHCVAWSVKLLITQDVISDDGDAGKDIRSRLLLIYRQSMKENESLAKEKVPSFFTDALTTQLTALVQKAEQDEKKKAKGGKESAKDPNPEGTEEQPVGKKRPKKKAEDTEEQAAKKPRKEIKKRKTHDGSEEGHGPPAPRRRARQNA